MNDTLRTTKDNNRTKRFDELTVMTLEELEAYNDESWQAYKLSDKVLTYRKLELQCYTEQQEQKK